MAHLQVELRNRLDAQTHTLYTLHPEPPKPQTLLKQARGFHHIKCGTPPALQAAGAGQQVGGRGSSLQQVMCPDACRQEALMRITPACSGLSHAALCGHWAFLSGRWKTRWALQSACLAAVSHHLILGAQVGVSLSKNETHQALPGHAMHFTAAASDWHGAQPSLAGHINLCHQTWQSTHHWHMLWGCPGSSNVHFLMYGRAQHVTHMANSVLSRPCWLPPACKTHNTHDQGLGDSLVMPQGCEVLCPCLATGSSAGHKWWCR